MLEALTSLCLAVLCKKLPMLTLAKSNIGLLLCDASVTQENIQKRHVSLFMGKSRLQKFEAREVVCQPYRRLIVWNTVKVKLSVPR